MPESESVTVHPETPSGKSAQTENFPVGSFLLPERLRPHVARFYAFARAADDIADNSDLSPQEKIDRLNDFEAVLAGEKDLGSGYAKAADLRTSLRETHVTDRHARDLLDAFRQDAVKNRYESWDELIGYCERSANPVGRYLLDLHGESEHAYPYSDALCTVLQIINHLQDCGDDLREMDRVYIPQDMMEEEGTSVEDLKKRFLMASMRRVHDRMLTRCEELLAAADLLPRAMKHRSLAMESAVIVTLAHRLTNRLKKQDPLAERVKLTKLDFARCGSWGALWGLVRFPLNDLQGVHYSPAVVAQARKHAELTVDQSGTSFGPGMRILTKPRRQAMYAVYAFCREIDDIADEGGTPDEKMQGLAEWRKEIDRLYEGAPDRLTGIALLEPVQRYHLPKEEFILLLEGMEMDAAGSVRTETMDDLYAYCRRVAGAVGMLSMPIFGETTQGQFDKFAIALSNALQITNVLRDVGEDALIDRLYIPREILVRHGIESPDPKVVIEHQNLPAAMAELGHMARRHFNEAMDILPKLNASRVRPALMMMGMYEAYLTRLEKRAFRTPANRVRLSTAAKIGIALRYALRPPKAA